MAIEIVIFFPLKMVIFHSCVSLPEGIEPETIEVDKPTEKNMFQTETKIFMNEFHFQLFQIRANRSN